MGTAIANQTELAPLVAEQHQVLAHESDRADRVLVEVLHRRDRVPVSPEQLAHWGTLPGLGELLVFCLGCHAEPPWCVSASIASVDGSRGQSSDFYRPAG